MSASTDTAAKQTSDTKTDPWAAQAPYLLQAFGGAQGALSKSQGAAAPTDFVAGMNPDQIATFHKMIGTGSDISTPQATGAAGASIVSPGTQGILSAIKGYQGFTPTGSTDQNIAAANKYASNVDVSGGVDAAMRDAVRTANEVTIPGMEYAAGNTGNINSSRVGLSEGVVKRGLADKAADLSATMRNDAFNNGTSAVLNQNAQDNSAKLGALSGLFGSASGAANTGANIASGSIGDIANLFSLAQQGGAGVQAGAQANLDNTAQKYDFQTNSPFDALKNFMQIVGGQSWGGQTSGTTSGTGSSTTNNPIGAIAGLMGATGSLIKSDMRSKEHIEQIGELFDGMPVYRFRYKGDPQHTMHIGLMAQDVEEVSPEAVIEIGGVKHVNYEIATDHLIAAPTRH
jgi:hypothetical protein